MIEVTYWRRLHRVTVVGHAGSAEHGHDLVCAAASALAYTLADNVNELHKTGAVKNTVLQVKEGCTEISCTPNRKMRSVVSLVYDTVCRGFWMLEENHPEHVRYTVMG